jgi:hypothetical protein
MKMTATIPIEPFFRPELDVGGVSTAAESALTQASWARIGKQKRTARLQSVDERRIRNAFRQLE